MSIASALLLIGCSGIPDRLIPGSYTYKISGALTLLSSDAAGSDEEQGGSLFKKEPESFEISPEQGQMHILEDGDSLIVTFNNILGNADVTSATLKNGTLKLSGKSTKSIQINEGGLRSWSGRVFYGGSGKRYDDMLILDLDYSGQITVSGKSMTIVSSDVKCVAQSNK